MSEIKPRILMVEDDHGLGQVYQTRLETEGFETQWVEDGERALGEALKFQPDVILLDIMMPKINGFDVLDILHNTPETSATKIIVLSALGQPDDIERAKSLGACEYLVKSQVAIADVVARIRHHLNNA